MPDPRPPAVSEHVENEVKLAVPAVFALPPLVDPEPDPTPPAQPANAQPVDAQPVDAQPVDAEPADAQPVDAQPVDGEEAEPAGADGAGHPVAAEAPDDRVVEAVPQPRRMLRAAYVDTPDLRLARSGATLRHRTGEGRPTWTLKLPTGTAHERLELSVQAPATTMPPQIRALVTAYVRESEPVEVVRLTTRRDAWLLRDADGVAVAEVVDDLVSVLSAGKVVARFRELEIERSGITDAALERVVGRLTDAGAVAGQFSSKLARALGPRASAAPDVPAAQRVRRGDPAAALVAEAVRDGVRRLLAQDPRVRLGRADGIHQMRVACRRLRSDLATFAPLLVPGSADAVRAELAWLADRLGGARDLEVLRDRLGKTFRADRLAPLDPDAYGRLDGELAVREQEALAVAATTLDEARYVGLLTAVVALAADPPVTDAAREPAKLVLPRLVGVVVHDLDLAVERLRPQAPDARWHRARIRAKRARYAAEAAAVALGPSAAATGAAMQDVQEILGDHQDAAVACDVLLATAAEHPDDPALVLLCGRLAERERAAVRDARARFGPAWTAAGTKAVRRWVG